MRGKVLIGFWVAVCSLAVATMAVAANDVHELKLSATAMTQDVVNGTPKIVHVKITEAQIANVARGRSFNDTSAPQEKLALARDWSSGRARLVVFDSVAKTKEAEVGDMTDDGMVETAKTGQLIMSVDVSATGSGDNHIDGGHLMISGKSKKDAQDRPTDIKGSVSGVLHTTVIENGVSRSVDVVIPKGKLSTGSKLGEFED